MNENQISRIIVESALKIHKQLGPGLLESAYEKCLFYELNKRGLSVEQQKVFSINYESILLDKAYRTDLVINNKVIIEIKSVKELHTVHSMQLLTYLRLSNMRLGMLINFNVELIKHGIKRLVNNL